MKSLLTWITLLFTTFACSNKQPPKDERSVVTETELQTEKTFKHVADFPTIKDTAEFISDLRRTFELEIHESPVQKDSQQITIIKKVKIYGSDKDYYFIEYDWKAGSMAGYPWKNQLLLTADGKLVKNLAGQRFEFVTIIPNQNPLLLIVTVTAKGNGGHEVYKFSADTIKNVYEGYYDYAVQTYDAHEDLYVFEPNELEIKFTDDNKDGFKDIVFTGQKLMLGKYTKDNS